MDWRGAVCAWGVVCMVGPVGEPKRLMSARCGASSRALPQAEEGWGASNGHSLNSRSTPSLRSARAGFNSQCALGVTLLQRCLSQYAWRITVFGQCATALCCAQSVARSVHKLRGDFGLRKVTWPRPAACRLNPSPGFAGSRLPDRTRSSLLYGTAAFRLDHCSLAGLSPAYASPTGIEMSSRNASPVRRGRRLRLPPNTWCYPLLRRHPNRAL